MDTMHAIPRIARGGRPRGGRWVAETFEEALPGYFRSSFSSAAWAVDPASHLLSTCFLSQVYDAA